MRRSAKEAPSRSKTPTNRDESWRFFDVAEITSATLIRDDDDDEEVKIAEEDMKELLEGRRPSESRRVRERQVFREVVFDRWWR